jgi:hypothetical protein
MDNRRLVNDQEQVFVASGGVVYPRVLGSVSTTWPFGRIEVARDREAVTVRAPLARAFPPVTLARDRVVSVERMRGHGLRFRTLDDPTSGTCFFAMRRRTLESLLAALDAAGFPLSRRN